MYSKNDKLISISIYLVTGTFLLLAIKMQGTQTVKEGEVQKKFFHPYMQSFTIFAGQTLYLIFYLMQKKKWRKQQSNQCKKPYNPYLFLIPACADTFTSILQMIGLNFITGSTFLMFKGSAIVTTMLFSKILIKKKLKKRHYFGCSITIFGMIIVAISSFFQEESHSHNEFAGYVFMLISVIFNGFFYAYEQYLLKRYHINFYQMVAYEGIYGGTIILILAIVLSYIPCNLGQKICVYDSNNNSFFEIPLVFFRQIWQNVVLLTLTISAMVLIGLFILNGIKITKMFDALTKSIVNITKTTLVWIIGIVITVFGPEDPDFRLQSLSLNVNMIKAVGFTIVIFGNLIYNKIIFKSYFVQKQNPQQTSAISSNLHKQVVVYESKQQGQIGQSNPSNMLSTNIQNNSDSLLQDKLLGKQDQLQ